MTETIKSWRADPLAWGRGPRQLEMFLEPTCPYSVKAFAKLDETLAAAGPDHITIKIRRQSQPWHMYSGVIVRCVLAASTLPTGKEAARAVLAAVSAHREEFEFTKHCSGSKMDATPNHIIARLENYCGLKLADAFAIPNLDREINGMPKMLGRMASDVSPDLYERWPGAARHEQRGQGIRLDSSLISKLADPVATHQAPLHTDDFATRCACP